MFDLPVLWASAALLLCWLVGAYNRLVRLRAAVVRSFGPLDAALLRLQLLLAECERAHAPAADRLQAAAAQFGASLAQARAQPLHAGATTALGPGWPRSTPAGRP